MNPHEQDDSSKAPQQPASGTASPGGPASPAADERREWQEDLREEADERSAGSDEASANTLEPAPGGNHGLHGGLVR